jgi:hypothetical protein
MSLKIKNLSYMRVQNVYMLIFTTITNLQKIHKKNRDKYHLFSGIYHIDYS